MKAKVGILGGGLAGLMTGWLLKENGEEDFVVLEAENTPGGLLKTFRKGDIVIDILPHVVFTSDPWAKSVFDRLIPERFFHRSRLGVYAKGLFLPYPFQLHLHEFSLEDKVRYLEDYFYALRDYRKGKKYRNMLELLVSSFGEAITKELFAPYNEKLWHLPLDQLSWDWTRRKIQGVEPRDMARSFLGWSKEVVYGHHSTFSYPRNGGIFSLVEALVEEIGADRVLCGHRVLGMDLRTHRVQTTAGTWSFEKVVWTLPLYRVGEIAGHYNRLCAYLRYNSVATVHLVLEAIDGLPEYHWLYVVDREVPFYRVTRVDLINLRYKDGPYPLIVEFSYPQGAFQTEEEILHATWSGLDKLGLRIGRKRVMLSKVYFTKPGYVVHDLKRAGIVRQLKRLLKRHDVFVAGRFGEWEYYNMDHTMASAKSAVQEVMEG